MFYAASFGAKVGNVTKDSEFCIWTSKLPKCSEGGHVCYACFMRDSVHELAKVPVTIGCASILQVA